MSWLGTCQSPRLQLLKPSHLSPVAAVKTFLSLAAASSIKALVAFSGSWMEVLVGYHSAM